MGFIHRAHQADCLSKVPAIELWKEQLKEARKQALEAMKQAQDLLGHKSTHKPYQKGQKVWLEGMNLHITHPTVKLRPKHYGPFRIIEAIGPTTYCLALPSQWKIHNTFHGSLLLPYHETKEHGSNFPEPAPELIEGQLEREVEEILNSRRYRRKLQYLIKWKGYSDAHNSWEPKENVNAPALLAAYHEQNTAAIRTLETEQADCGQSTSSLESQERAMRTLPQEEEHPLEPKRKSIRHFGTNYRCHQKTEEALNPDNCTQKGNRCIKDETKTQPATSPRKATGFVQKLRAILLQPLRKLSSQEKTTEEPEECKCSICKRNKGAVQEAIDPLRTHIPTPMTIRSIRIDQKRHRISTLGTIQEEERPNRRTPETGTEETTKVSKSYQGEEGGRKAELQKRDKRQTRTGEQEASHPIHLAPLIAHHPLMHGSLMKVTNDILYAAILMALPVPP